MRIWRHSDQTLELPRTPSAVLVLLQLIRSSLTVFCTSLKATTGWWASSFTFLCKWHSYCQSLVKSICCLGTVSCFCGVRLMATTQIQRCQNATMLWSIFLLQRNSWIAILRAVAPQIFTELLRQIPKRGVSLRAWLRTQLPGKVATPNGKRFVVWWKPTFCESLNVKFTVPSCPCSGTGGVVCVCRAQYLHMWWNLLLSICAVLHAQVPLQGNFFCSRKANLVIIMKEKNSC